MQISYYVAPFSLSKDSKIYYVQQSFFKRLKKAGIRVVKHRVSSESNKIKGDDIHLAVDMLDDAFCDLFDVAILVSGDGDFEPLVRKIHKYGKKVELHYFTGQTSSRLKKSCDTCIRISRSLIMKCVLTKKK